MVKKLSLDDLKVQSFVTTVTDEEARRLMGASGWDGTIDCCSEIGPACSSTQHSWCCPDPSWVTDASCGCSQFTTPCYTGC